MKLLLCTLLLFSLSAHAFDYITCGHAKSGTYSLEIEVDIFESQPKHSLVKLYQNGELVGEEKADKVVQFIETMPLETAYNFSFIEDQEFEFLEVNLTKMSATMIPGFVDSDGKMIKISFQACEFE